VAVPEVVVSAVGGISGSVQLRACREWIAGVKTVCVSIYAVKGVLVKI